MAAFKSYLETSTAPPSSPPPPSPPLAPLTPITKPYIPLDALRSLFGPIDCADKTWSQSATDEVIALNHLGALRFDGDTHSLSQMKTQIDAVG